MHITQDHSSRTVLVELDEPTRLELDVRHVRHDQKLVATSLDVEFKDGSFLVATIRVRALRTNGNLGRHVEAVRYWDGSPYDMPQVVADALAFIRTQED